jgi:poly(3-hydroxybutyrate) depolymerase
MPGFANLSYLIIFELALLFSQRRLSIDGVLGQASLQKVSNFGVNPTRLEMLIHVPPKLAAKPPIVLMVCTTHEFDRSFVDTS